jgi:RNA polymerase sigma-70 factor, ECF subfamily
MKAPASDESLMEQFVRGDRAGLAALAERHERLLLGLARGLLSGREDLALDAVQETWVRVIRFAGGFEGRSAVRTWLTRILVNQCRSMRGMLRRGMGELGGGDGGRASEAGSSPSDERLWRALEGLGEGPREVVLLCYHHGLTHEMVAEVLEVPVGTVKSRLHAGLRDLRAALSPEGAR